MKKRKREKNQRNSKIAKNLFYNLYSTPSIYVAVGFKKGDVNLNDVNRIHIAHTTK